MIPQVLVDEDIKKWLAIDIPYWDITTNLLPNIMSKGKIYARQDGIIAGLIFVQRVFELVGTEFESLIEEGSRVSKKTAIASIKGDIHNLLQAERLALNLLGRISGIATQTNHMLQIARKSNPNIRICATRKTVPGLS
ncbi:MAG: nicotinate-nucleotide diphosphorylase (carboxylating), partial [Candidatus Heimdallarchaeota archaeon]|nr:nicotinate-nucleotide diphosphorylase (carboxylating) [Candidatus Heimdallarchaeota archaeon]